MSKHTPEPWAHAPEGMIVSMSTDTQPEDAVVANIKPRDAIRIVTCVNACAGMADPAAEIAELTRQRDELLAALHDAAKALDELGRFHFSAKYWSSRAYSAIAETKGFAS